MDLQLRQTTVAHHRRSSGLGASRHRFGPTRRLAAARPPTLAASQGARPNDSTPAFAFLEPTFDRLLTRQRGPPQAVREDGADVESALDVAVTYVAERHLGGSSSPECHGARRIALAAFEWAVRRGGRRSGTAASPRGGAGPGDEASADFESRCRGSSPRGSSAALARLGASLPNAPDIWRCSSMPCALSPSRWIGAYLASNPGYQKVRFGIATCGLRRHGGLAERVSPRVFERAVVARPATLAGPWNLATRGRWTCPRSSSLPLACLRALRPRRSGFCLHRKTVDYGGHERRTPRPASGASSSRRASRPPRSRRPHRSRERLKARRLGGSAIDRNRLARRYQEATPRHCSAPHERGVRAPFLVHLHYEPARRHARTRRCAASCTAVLTELPTISILDERKPPAGCPATCFQRTTATAGVHHAPDPTSFGGAPSSRPRPAASRAAKLHFRRGARHRCVESTPRRMGRFAAELWLERSLIDACASDALAGGRRQATSGLVADVTIRLPSVSARHARPRSGPKDGSDKAIASSIGAGHAPAADLEAASFRAVLASRIMGEPLL